MSNKTQLQTNNTNLDALIARVNAAKNVAASLPEAGGSGGGGADNVYVYVRVKADSPVTEATIHYTAPDGNVRTIITDTLEGDWQEFEAAVDSSIHVYTFATINYSDFGEYVTDGDSSHFFLVQEIIGPDDYHEIIFDEH